MKSALPEGFRVDGTVYLGGGISPIVRKAIAVLEKLPFKELVTTRQLSAMIQCSMHTMQQHGIDPSIKDYRFKASNGSSVFWGSKRTINELKRVNRG